MPNPVVPSLPPLSSISDPSVRAALQAVYDQLRVRNGEVGDGDNRFLTPADLNETIKAAVGTSSGGRRSGFAFSAKAGSSAIGTAIANLVDAAVKGVTDSWLYKKLEERLQIIETPTWFQNKFGAAFQQEQAILETQIEAQATVTNTAIANINGNLALAQETIQATADLAGSTASKTTDLQVTMYGVNGTPTNPAATSTMARAQNAFTLSSKLDGQVSGSWNVKFDLNGYVVGAGLGVSGKGGTYSSEFIVRADRFAIAAPSGSTADPVVPFVVHTTPFMDPSDPTNTLPAGTYLNNNVYLNGDMFVAGAITASRISGMARVASGVTSCSITLTDAQVGPSGATAIIFAGANWLSSGGGDYSFYLDIDGTNQVGVSQKGGFSTSATTARVVTGLGAGTHTFTQHTSAPGASGAYGSRFIFALLIMA